MSKEPFQVSAQFGGLSYTVDGGLSIRFRTQELTEAEKAQVADHHMGFGWLLFQENPFDLKDVPKEPAKRETESPSKRLRAVLYLVYKKIKPEEDFETWYSKQMESHIESAKTVLQDYD